MNLAAEFAEDDLRGLTLHLERGWLMSGGEPLVIHIEKRRIIPSNRIPPRFRTTKVCALVGDEADTPASLLRKLADLFEAGDVPSREAGA